MAHLVVKLIEWFRLKKTASVRLLYVWQLHGTDVNMLPRTTQPYVELLERIARQEAISLTKARDLMTRARTEGNCPMVWFMSQLTMITTSVGNPMS
jgi:RNase P subunit RPR2